MLQTLYYLSALSVHHFSIFIFDSLPIEHQSHCSCNRASPSTCFDIKCQQLLSKAPHRRHFYVHSFTACSVVYEFTGNHDYNFALVAKPAVATTVRLRIDRVFEYL